ncbi:MAG TPA: GTP cyclohydrolase I [Gaiellaceae bacterium]|nr:GTP cyclohydrolase I [Gaiellaceae bacterium]
MTDPVDAKVLEFHTRWEHVEPRHMSDADVRRFEGYAAEILSACGMDLHTPGTEDTPRRFVQALFDATAGYDGDAKLRTVFPSERPDGLDAPLGQIVEGPIAFFSLCEHHALPFHGLAHVGYVAGDEILGISKLTRLVRLFARRFTVQERLGEQIADALVELVGARGVAVHLDAAHLCTQMRGVNEEGSRTRTTVFRGVYEDAALRREFLAEVRRP